MNYSVNWLEQQIRNNIAVEYLFFWGHTPNQPNSIDKSCFSQWYPSPFSVEGITYFTAEHWMMAKKAELFNDQQIFEKIITEPKPGAVKAFGREIKNFDDEIWKAAAFEIVVEGNRHKFSQNNLIKEYLVNTGNKILAEASPTDFIWGIGLAQDNEDATNPDSWKGTNLLGFALMEVRDLLK